MSVPVEGDVLAGFLMTPVNSTRRLPGRTGVPHGVAEKAGGPLDAFRRGCRVPDWSGGVLLGDRKPFLGVKEMHAEILSSFDVPILHVLDDGLGQEEIRLEAPCFWLIPPWG
jgi:hypothetical protein